MSESLVVPPVRCRVSSVIENRTNDFGKKFLFDGNAETCWSSEPGLPQYIVVDFAVRAVRVEQLVLTFQGGFAAKNVELLGLLVGATQFTPLAQFFPLETNDEQTFACAVCAPVTRLKVLFTEGTDFYGRIMVYKLDVLGAYATD
eukprot:TRINITY_DN774_c0_g1_i1.p2 TRINITY_DN774_c0_g1~~TRINITY_DN774_c0_g1_i1.p2  ORF type:complete len:154 (-),score=17.70 TRINITY_DN774_c0_g1_i1:1674-2108(-)